ncbi:MAG: redoxin domain-containing protein [Nitrospinae bacterium]|nr:redoxin domain-containing protein [Nitrospinota bacterium]
MIAGASRDTPQALKKWAGQYDLPFTLLSDPSGGILRDYGAWGEKNNYGKVSEGAIRSTVVIDEEGRVFKTYYNIKAAGHAAKVLADL